MAKGSLLMGKQSGKLGQSVLSTRYGEQIQRAYVKEIANPKTEAQVATRSRFKLASQLSAAMADVIAIPRVGSKTGRNQFVSATMDITSEAAGVAQVSLNSVQLTKSQRGLIGFAATRDTANNKIGIALKGANGSAISRIVYVAFEKQNDGSLVLFDSKVISEAGESGTFNAELKGTSNSVVLYAYGITDKDGATSVKFGNLNAPTAEQVAKLLTTSSDTLSGVLLTKTNGATMNAGEDSCDSDEAEPAPPVETTILTAIVNNEDWDHNYTDASPNVEVRGTALARSAVKVALIGSTNKPQVGESIDHLAVSQTGNISNGAFTMNDSLVQGERYWLCAGTQADANSPFIVEAVWNYKWDVVE